MELYVRNWEPEARTSERRVFSSTRDAPFRWTRPREGDVIIIDSGTETSKVVWEISPEFEVEVRVESSYSGTVKVSGDIDASRWHGDMSKVEGFSSVSNADAGWLLPYLGDSTLCANVNRVFGFDLRDVIHCATSGEKDGPPGVLAALEAGIPVPDFPTVGEPVPLGHEDSTVAAQRLGWTWYATVVDQNGNVWLFQQDDADRFWVGGGSSANWDATGNTNWSATSGGANNASVPIAGDTQTFDGGGNSACTMNVAIPALTSTTVAAGYTATITVTSGNQTLGNWGATAVHNGTLASSQAGGFIAAAPTTFTMDGGTVNIVDTNLMRPNNTVSISGGTWTSGTLQDLGIGVNFSSTITMTNVDFLTNGTGTITLTANLACGRLRVSGLGASDTATLAIVATTVTCSGATVVGISTQGNGIVTFTTGTYTANGTVTVGLASGSTGSLGSNTAWTFTQAGALTNNATGTINAPTGTGWTATANIDISAGTFNADSGTITASASINFKAGATGNPYNLTTSGTVTVTLTANVTFDHALTIAANGTFTTSASNYSLTVTNATSISGTLTCNASTCIFNGTGTASGYSLETAGTGVVNMGSATVTAGAIYLNGTGTNVLTSGTLTLNSAGSAVNIAFAFNSGIALTHNSGTVTFTRASATQEFYDSANTARTLYNLTINGSSNVTRFAGGNGFALTVANNLTVTAGTFNTSDTTGGVSRNLTVTNATSVTGTLTPNTSTVTFNGAVTINSGGTLGGNSAYTQSTTANLTISSGGTWSAPNASGTNNFSGATFTPTGTYTANSGTFTNTRTGTTSLGAAWTSANALQVNSGATFDTTASNYALTVANSTTLTGTITCNGSAVSLGSGTNHNALQFQGTSTPTFNGGTGTHTLGGANCNPGTNSPGTFSLTTGTTTFNGASVAPNYLTWNLQTNFTVTHNNGTVTMNYAGTQAITGSASYALTLYNLTVNNASDLVHVGSSTQIGSVTVANNLTVTAGSFDTSSTNGAADLATCTVTGSTSISGTVNCKSTTCSFGSGLTSPANNYAIFISSGTYNGNTATVTTGSIGMAAAGGTVNLSSGNTTIDSATTGNANICFNLNSSTTFSNGSGTLIFTRNGSQLLTDGQNTARTLYNLTTNGGASQTVRFYNGLGYNLTCSNSLTISQGTFDTSETVSGTSRNLTVTGTSSITGTLTPNTSTVTFNGAVTVNSGGTAGGNTAWTCDLNANGTVSSGGTWNAPNGSGTWTFGTSSSTTFTSNSGCTFNANSGTMNCDGTAAMALDMGTKTYYNVTVSGAGNLTMQTTSGTVSNVLTVNTSRTFTMGNTAITLTLSGSGTPFVLNGTFAPGTAGTVTYTGASATNLTATTYYNVGCNQSGTTFTHLGNITANNNVSVTAGTWAKPDFALTWSGTHTIAGTFDDRNSSFDQSRASTGGTMNLNGGTILVRRAWWITVSGAGTANIIYLPASEVVVQNCTMSGIILLATPGQSPHQMPIQALGGSYNRT